MAFLSSLTDAFTGDPAKQAAASTRNYLGGVQTSGNAAIDSAAGQASGVISGGMGAGRDALTGGYNAATGAVGAGGDAALGYLDAGNAAAGGYYDAARGAYSPLSALGQKYGGATSLALNALGVNGQPGTDAARQQFTAGPGYNFNLDQGIEAINRRRNMGGMLDSGNADRDAQTFGAGLASNQYNTWMNSLLGFTNPELSATSGAASGVAGVDTSQAGAQNQVAQAKSGVATGRAAMLSDLANQYGTKTAGLETGGANSLADIFTGAAGQKVGLAKGVAQPYANTYGQEAAAEQQGSANLWNLLGNAGKLGAGVAGKLAA